MANAIDLEFINEGDIDWASKINRNLVKIRDHTHDDQAGTGFEVNLDSISCVSDLVFNRIEGQITIGLVESFSFTSLPETIVSKRTVYARDGELCFSNGIGVTVQITSKGTLNINTVGGSGFTGNLSTYGAHVDYTSATSLYEFFGNANSATTINCGNVSIQSSTIGNITPVDSASFSNLNVSNFAPVANGQYLLHGTEPYVPTLVALPFSLFATTSALAKANIAQIFGSGAQRAIQTSYTTNMFCYVNSMINYVNSLGVNQLVYFKNPGSIQPGSGGYVFPRSVTDPPFQGSGLLFGCYNRMTTGKNPGYKFINQYYFIGGSEFKSSVFTVLSWKSSRGST